MPSGERRCLIQEEQFRVSTIAKHFALAPVELEFAGYPSLSIRLPNYLLVIVVQLSPIAKQRPASTNCVQATPRINAVLKRHRCLRKYWLIAETTTSSFAISEWDTF